MKSIAGESLNFTALPGIYVDKKHVFIISPPHCPVWFLMENQTCIFCRYHIWFEWFFQGRKDIARYLQSLPNNLVEITQGFQ